MGISQKDWEEILESLKGEMTDIAFRMWFQNCRFVDSSDNALVLGFPSRFVKDWVQKNYAPLIKNLYCLKLGSPPERVEIYFEILPEQGSIEMINTHQPSITEMSQPFPKKTNPSLPSQPNMEKGSVQTPPQILPLPKIQSEVSKKASDKISEFGVSPHQKSSPPIEITRFQYEKRCKELNVIPEFSFETYVRGTGNHIAFSVCEAVSKTPPQKAVENNPVFIYGDVGLGKTHLLHAIANCFLERDLNAKVCNVTSEQFVNDFILQIQRKDFNPEFDRFRNKYRDVDILLVDDIQFLHGKERMQEEFYNTFNEVFRRSIQIVIASDRSPTQLKEISSRLVSRFDGGQIVSLHPPDYSHRLAIIKNFIQQKGIRVSDEDLSLMAEIKMENIRQIIGNLKRLCSRCEYEKRPLDKKLILEVLESGSTLRQIRIDIPRIILIVCKYFGVEEQELRGSKRKKALTYPRHIAMFLARELTNKSLMAIGKEFGGRDHSSVLYSIEKVQKEIGEDLDSSDQINLLKRQITLDSVEPL